VKKHPKSEIEVRKICSLDAKRDAWMIRIPRTILDELEIRRKFVTLEIKESSLVITEVVPANAKRISEKVTAQTIKQEADNSETIIKKSKKELKVISKPEIKQSPSEKSESSTEKQNETDRIDKIIEDSVNKIEL